MMTPCPDCSYEISKHARFCPNCGAHFKDVKATIVEIDIGFGALVGLWFKVAIAATPLALLVTFLWWVWLEI